MKKNDTAMSADVMKLFSGSVITQILAIATLPILTRMFDPADFGVAALFIAITTICATVACLRFEFAIILPERDHEAVNVAGLSILCAVGVSLLLVLLLYLFGPSFATWFDLEEVESYFLWIPLVVFLSGAVQVIHKWNARFNRFGRQSITMVLRRLTASLGGITAGLLGFATGGALVVVQVIATATGFLMAGILGLPSLCVALRSGFSIRQVGGMARRYRRLPLFNSWAAVLNALSVLLPTLLLAGFFSTAVAGLYALSYRLVVLPIRTLGGSIQQVFFRRAADAKNQGVLGDLVGRTLRFLLLMVGFPFFLLGMVGPQLFVVVFGAEWQDAGLYAQILSPWLMFVFLGNPLASLNIVLGIEHMGLIFNILLVAMRVGALAAGGFLDDPVLAIILFSAAGVIGWLMFLSFLLRKAGVPVITMYRDLLVVILLSGLSLLPLGISMIMGWFNMFSLVPLLFLCGGLYFWVVVKKFPEARELVRQARKRIPWRIA